MRTVHGWRKARGQLERWRKDLTTVSVVLKTPRVIDINPVNFITGEPVEQLGKAQKKFSGKLIHFTADDAILRRPSGALLVVDTYEMESLTAAGARVIP
jgi:hypothetical protein